METAPDILKRFWVKVEQTDNCWNWVSSKNLKGYGQFWYNDKPVYAHRFSYELFKGDIPKGMTLDHLCRNHSCVNPEHLEAVTSKENILRGVGTAAIHARKTHCPRGHELKEPNLLKSQLKRGQRNCRICYNKNQNTRWRKKNTFSSLIK